MARRVRSRPSPPLLPAPVRSALSEAYHQRFLYLFDDALGKLLRDNPDVEERVNELTAEIFEIMAEGLRSQKRAGNGNGRRRR